MDLPFLPVLCEMEEQGVLIDTGKLLELGTELGTHVQQIEEAINLLAGKEVNTRSPLQVSALLYDELGLPMHRKLGRATDRKALEWLKGRHPIVDLLSEHRRLSKLKSTYADKIPNVVCPRCSRLYSHFNNTVVETGRLSSSNPVNLQNIPKREANNASPLIWNAVKQIRRSFIARAGYRLVKFDQAAVEFKILLCFANEVPYLEAVAKGLDLHIQTVADWKGITYDQALLLADLKLARDIAKTVNYATAYGQTEIGFHEWCQGQGLDMSMEDAKRIREAILQTKPNVLIWMEQVKRQVLTQGYVETYFGRRIYYPDYKDPRRWVREKVCREAVNAVIQGTAADIMKIAAYRIWQELRRKGMKARVILAVHDELVFECPEEEVDALAGIIWDIAESVVDWQVPLTVDVEVGPTWADTEKIKRRIS